MDMQLEIYGEHQPTMFDPKGAFLPDRQDWLIVIGHSRDSGPLDESNFWTALRELGGEGKDVEVHRFRHWGPGWYEIILVRPDTQAHETAKELRAALADYPVLDETDYSERVHEAALESWHWLDLRDRMAICVKHGVSKFAARRRDQIPRDLPHYEDFYNPE